MHIKKSQLQKFIIEEAENLINEISKRKVRFKKRRQAALLSDPKRGKYGLGGAGITVQHIQMALLDIDPDKYIPILSGVKSTNSNERAKNVITATDGKYGRRTYNAIRAFQKDFPPDDKTGADGLVGAFTAAKIIEQAPNSEFATKLKDVGFVANMSAAGHEIIQKGREAAAASPAPEDPNVVVSPEDGPQKRPETVDASGAAGIVLDKPEVIQTASKGVAKGTYKKMAVEAPEDLESLLVQLSKEAEARGDELRNLTGLPKGAPAERINKYLDFMVKTYKKDLASRALEEAQGDSEEMLQKINNLAKAQHKAYSIFDQARKEKAEAIREKLQWDKGKPPWVAAMINTSMDEDTVQQIYTRYDYIKQAYPRFTSSMFQGSFGMTAQAYLATRKPETLVAPQAAPTGQPTPATDQTSQPDGAPAASPSPASTPDSRIDDRGVVTFRHEDFKVIRRDLTKSGARTFANITVKDLKSGRTATAFHKVRGGNLGNAFVLAQKKATDQLVDILKNSVNESKKKIKIKLIESNRQTENTTADLNPDTVARLKARNAKLRTSIKATRADTAAKKALRGVKRIGLTSGSTMTWTDIVKYVQSGDLPPKRQQSDGKYIES